MGIPQATFIITLVYCSGELTEPDTISIYLISDLIACRVLYHLLYEMIYLLDCNVKFTVYVQLAPCATYNFTVITPWSVVYNSIPSTTFGSFPFNP